MLAGRAAAAVRETWTCKFNPISCLPEAVLGLVLEFAKPTSLLCRATNWAHLDEVEEAGEPEDPPLETPRPWLHHRPPPVEPRFLSGHGQFLEKTVFSSSPAVTISVSDFIGETGSLLPSIPSCLVEDGGGCAASLPLGSSPTSVGDILSVWSIDRGPVSKCTGPTLARPVRIGQSPAAYLGDVSVLEQL